MVLLKASTSCVKWEDLSDNGNMLTIFLVIICVLRDRRPFLSWKEPQQRIEDMLRHHYHHLHPNQKIWEKRPIYTTCVPPYHYTKELLLTILMLNSSSSLTTAWGIMASLLPPSYNTLFREYTPKPTFSLIYQKQARNGSKITIIRCVQINVKIAWLF